MAKHPDHDSEQSLGTAAWPAPKDFGSDAPTSVQPGRGLSRSSWLTTVALVVMAGHLALVLRHLTSAQLGITLICWYAVAILVGRKRSQLAGPTSIAAASLGWLLLALSAVQGWAIDSGRDAFLYLYPLVAGMGLALVASGFGGLRRFWAELTILFCLGVPRGFLSHWVDLSPLSAHSATLVLWYLGRDVQLVGTEIVMPGGSVNVDKTCDGTGVIAYLLCLGVVFVLLFPVHGGRRLAALVAAPVLAFLTNLMRILTLALLENAGRHDRFEYWHDGQGSLVWTVLPVLLFAIVALTLLPRPARPVSAG